MTLKVNIKNFLFDHYPEYIAGGNIEDYIRANFGNKGDTTARELRKLVELGEIEVKKEPYNQYKLKV